MPNQELLDFVKLKRGQGINDEEIKKELVASGWPEITVNESLGSLASPISPQIETKISRFPVVIAFVAGIIFVAGIYIVAGGVKWPQGVGKEYNTKEIANIWGSSVVRIVCDEDFGVSAIGSGTLWKVNNDYVVTTNEHVANSQACVVEVTPFRNGVSNSRETLTYKAKESSFRTIEGDYDFLSFSLEEYDSKSPLSKLADYAHKADRKCGQTFYQTGEKVVIMGYPSIGASEGGDLNITEGIISGVEEGFSFSDQKQFTWYVTSAKIEHGNSGGAAVAADGCFIGIPTWGIRGELESQGRIFIYGGENSFIINNLEALVLWTQKI